MAVTSGPTVSLDFKKEKLNFGKTPVLTKVERKMKLTNESLVPATYEITIRGKPNVFAVNHERGVIQPNQQLNLVVTVSRIFFGISMKNL